MVTGPSGVSGIEGLGPELVKHFQTAGAPGAYERVGQALAALADGPTAAPEVLETFGRAWAGRTFHASYERPLLALAALRFRALEDDQHPLAPEVLMDADAPDVPDRLREALRDRSLVPVLAARSVQTNEPGRAWGWGLTALVLGLAHRRFALVDMGCSAGLNLVVDRTAIPYRLGANQVAGFDFPSPESRVGLDRAPIDAADETAARWLRACIWPGQSDRLQRFEACRKVYANRWPGEAPAPALVPHELGGGTTRAVLEDVAARPGSDVTLAFESVTRSYLAAEARLAHDEGLWAFLGGDRQRLWAVLEPSADPVRLKTTAPMDLTVSLVRGGERVTVTLGQSGYHAASSLIVPGAVDALRAAWARA